MTTTQELEARVEELEADLRERDDKIKELRDELREATHLVDDMREHLEDGNALIDKCIEVFDMRQGDDGGWLFDPEQSKLWEDHAALRDDHRKLVAEWNRMVARYNVTVAPQPLGRPLAASEAQVKDVLKRRKSGEAIRKIGAATGLTLRTVRTIIERDTGKGRTGARANELRKREFNRLRAAEYRARKKARDGLPERITDQRKRGDELVKAAKGLGKSL